MLALILLVAMRVVVYPDRAQVSVSRAATCGARGAVAVPFEGITPAADPNSFRALSTDASVLGVRAELRAQPEAFSAKAEKLDAQIRALESEVRGIRDAIDRAANQTRVAHTYGDVAAQMVGREMVLPGANPEAWDHAFSQALHATIEAHEAQVEARTAQRETQRKLDEARRQRNELAQASRRQSWFAEVLLGCERGGNAHAELSYMTGGASWEPLYEARADEKGGTVQLAMYATVRQATGDAWKGAQVVLSTAIPRQDATPPEVTPLRVGAQEKKAEKKVLVRRDEEQQHAEAAEPSAAAQEAPGMEAAAQGLSVQLRVKEASDIAGDGTPARLFVGAHRLQARYAYRTIPKLLPYVFRVADLVNTAPFPLLPGMVDTFRRSGFIARTPLERVAEGARFHLSLGLEDGIKVKRIVRDEMQRDKGLFGTTRRFRYEYRFELTSALKRPEVVELSDHIAVSELDDVKVELEERTTGPREWRADDGVVTWKVEVPAGGKKDVDLAFHVDVPSSYDSGGL